MVPAGDSKSTALPRPGYRPSLTIQIFIGLILGGFFGWLRPEWSNKVYFLRDIFLNLIKSIIAALVFLHYLRKAGELSNKNRDFIQLREETPHDRVQPRPAYRASKAARQPPEIFTVDGLRALLTKGKRLAPDVVPLIAIDAFADCDRLRFNA